jgi:transcriptional regulator with XRE-family HTH domain
MDTKELIERAQKRNGIKNMTGIAEAIGINQSSLSLLKSGKSELSDETYIKLAKLAGVDPAEVLIEKHERKAGPEARAVWARINAAVSKSAVLGLSAMLLLPALQTHADTSKFQVPHNKYYANHECTSLQ